MHKLRKRDDNNHQNERKPMAFKHKRIDFQINLVKSADTKPEPQKRFDTQKCLKTGQSLFADLPENLGKHIDTAEYGDNECGRYHFPDMFHDRFACFLRFVRGQALSHSGHEEVVRKEKTAVDECSIEVNGVNDGISDGKSFFRAIIAKCNKYSSPDLPTSLAFLCTIII